VRLSQCFETHLKRCSDIAGTRERISTRRSSASLSAAVPLVGEEDDLQIQERPGISQRRKVAMTNGDVALRTGHESKCDLPPAGGRDPSGRT
jgi:hypothetical protein